MLPGVYNRRETTITDTTFTIVRLVQCKQRLYKHTIVKVVFLIKA